MKILLVGSGAREHALAWQIAQSDLCTSLFCVPGNAGIESCAECIDISATDVEKIVQFAEENKIDLVVVGPEQPLVLGLVDALAEKGIKAFGPRKNAAILEGSKVFTKDLCKKYNIPTADYGRFSDIKNAKTFIERQTPPIVVKADGLAAGKGVIIAQSHNEAVEAAESMLSGESFGEAGREIVVEEFLDGEEVSFFAMTDGKHVVVLPSAQDHKRAFDNDEGPNTGGMGGYSPARLMNAELEKKIIDRIINPTVSAMKSEGRTFKGILFAGLMIVNNEPYLIEYNVRFGDPECQMLMMRLQSDVVELLNACTDETLNTIQEKVIWSDDPSLCVIMATKGYPAEYPKNTPIKDIDKTADVQDVVVFHAGTRKDVEGNLLSYGGRVLAVTARGADLKEAKGKAYRSVDLIDWPDGFYRSDIGWRALGK